ncbi:hypothetical protein FJZ18_04135 [Candidatus Pacearchaeota archaeon]|nr:hypothetical protein [Candidatus Pacearchaeota archaeon]
MNKSQIYGPIAGILLGIAGASYFGAQAYNSAQELKVTSNPTEVEKIERDKKFNLFITAGSVLEILIAGTALSVARKSTR